MKQIITLKEQVDKITTPGALFKNIGKIDIDYSQENFVLFALSTKNQIIKTEVVFKGGLNATSIDLKTIFRKALINNANSIIVAHNHPSGDLNPSPDDEIIFDKIKKAGELITIKCLDSIIFNEKEFYSMN